MRNYLSVLLTAILCLSLLTACGHSDTPNQPPLASGSVIVADDSIPDISPNISGVVTNVSRTREGIVMLVEIPGENNSYAAGRVYVTVTAKTVVESNDKKRLERGDCIMPGYTVSVWYSGNATGTSPEYAMAQGVRITSQVEDLLLTVRHGNTTVMASPAEGEVTLSDIQPLLYGSYLVFSGEGELTVHPAKPTSQITVSAISASAGDGTVHHFKFDSYRQCCEIPAGMTEGDYTVTVKAEYDDGADYYIFTLSIR